MLRYQTGWLSNVYSYVIKLKVYDIHLTLYCRLCCSVPVTNDFECESVVV